MKTNQKYTQEEMSIAIELWQESNLSQHEFCRREGLPYHIFLYWLKKFRKQKSLSLPQSFIPVKVAQNNDCLQGISDIITIDYPNGVQVHCPFHLGIDQIRNLIKL